MSIPACLQRLLLLLLLLGVASAGRAPIGRQAARSICAALCVAGLGGEPCGAPCATLTPRNVSQSGGGGGGGVGVGGTSRRDACPLLCAYRLGAPLCDCPATFGRLVVVGGGGRQPPVDYHRICEYFCREHDYRIYGCPECGVYRAQDLDRRVRPTEMDIDWEQWCKDQCAIGMGGVACACNLPLPLPMNVRPDGDVRS